MRTAWQGELAGPLCTERIIQGRIRRSCDPAKLCLMRFAYQAYEAHTFVGRIRRSCHPTKLCLMRFAYQAYEADTFVGWLRHPITR